MLGCSEHDNSLVPCIQGREFFSVAEKPLGPEEKISSEKLFICTPAVLWVGKNSALIQGWYVWLNVCLFGMLKVLDVRGNSHRCNTWLFTSFS